jgi:hypothetical protein
MNTTQIQSMRVNVINSIARAQGVDIAKRDDTGTPMYYQTYNSVWTRFAKETR